METKLNSVINKISWNSIVISFKGFRKVFNTVRIRMDKWKRRSRWMKI